MWESVPNIDHNVTALVVLYLTLDKAKLPRLRICLGRNNAGQI